ncbi:MAG: DUF1971 domain-containing protein [Planctomycetota bacterium]
MTQKRIPDGLAPQGSSPLFTNETIPPALLEPHTLPAGKWAVLHLLCGNLTYVDLADGSRLEISAPELVTIAPRTPHRLELTEPMVARVDFFQEVSEEPLVGQDVLLEADQAVRESFARCEERGGFGERFYDQFLRTSPEIDAFFARTTFNSQAGMLRDSVAILVRHHIWDPEMKRELKRLGESHGRDALAVPPRLYRAWIDALCATVRDWDPECDGELERKWRLWMSASIQFITAGY